MGSRSPVAGDPGVSPSDRRSVMTAMMPVPMPVAATAPVVVATRVPSTFPPLIRMALWPLALLPVVRMEPENPAVLEGLRNSVPPPDLASVPHKIDLVDVFRAPEHVPAIVETPAHPVPS